MCLAGAHRKPLYFLKHIGYDKLADAVASSNKLSAILSSECDNEDGTFGTTVMSIIEAMISVFEGISGDHFNPDAIFLLLKSPICIGSQKRIEYILERIVTAVRGGGAEYASDLSQTETISFLLSQFGTLSKTCRQYALKLFA